jgi:transposase-like protein
MIDIFKGKPTPVEVARQHGLTVAEFDRWVEEAGRNTESGLRSRPRDVREQYEKKLQETRDARGDAPLQICALKNNIGACSTTREPCEIAADAAHSRRSLCLAQ